MQSSTSAVDERAAAGEACFHHGSAFRLMNASPRQQAEAAYSPFIYAPRESA